MDRVVELQHLRKTDAGIADARVRIERQIALIARLENHGHDATSAKWMLATMRETLILMEEHRTLIMNELASEPPGSTT